MKDKRRRGEEQEEEKKKGKHVNEWLCIKGKSRKYG